MSGRKKVTQFLSLFAYVIEVLISVVILMAVLVLLVELVFDSQLFNFKAGHLDFNEFLNKAFTLIIGVEFTKMLYRHTSETVVEVLLFATARQIVISHSSVLDTLLGVAAIAVLFAIKRFLLSPDYPEGDLAGRRDRGSSLFSLFLASKKKDEEK